MSKSKESILRILHLEASPGWGGQEIRILKEADKSLFLPLISQ